jgi:hypothetical protein
MEVWHEAMIVVDDWMQWFDVCEDKGRGDGVR